MDVHRRMYATLIDAYGAGALTRFLIDETKAETFFKNTIKKDPTLQTREALLVDIVDADAPSHEVLAKHNTTLADAKRTIRRFVTLNARFFRSRLTPVMAGLYFIFFSGVMTLITMAMNDDPLSQAVVSSAVGGVVFSFIMTVLFRKNSVSDRTVDKMTDAFVLTFIDRP